jgi:hypothetical protein
MAEDAAKAHRAIWSLVAAPKQALRLLKTHLRPVAANTKETLRWIEQLEDDNFELRKKAAAELEKLVSLLTSQPDAASNAAMPYR